MMMMTTMIAQMAITKLKFECCLPASCGASPSPSCLDQRFLLVPLALLLILLPLLLLLLLLPPSYYCCCDCCYCCC